MSYLQRYNIPNTSAGNLSEPMSSIGFSGEPVDAAGNISGGGFGDLFGGMGGMMMGLNAANSFMGGMQQAGLNKSAQAALDAQKAMFDAGFGRDVFAQNFDRFRSFNDPVIAAKIAVNTPAYRQSRTMQGLPELAGKYGRFGAFVS